jgi:hypothetical protein
MTSVQASFHFHVFCSPSISFGYLKVYRAQPFLNCILTLNQLHNCVINLILEKLARIEIKIDVEKEKK